RRANRSRGSRAAPRRPGPESRRRGRPRRSRPSPRAEPSDRSGPARTRSTAGTGAREPETTAQAPSEQAAGSTPARRTRPTRARTARSTASSGRPSAPSASSRRSRPNPVERLAAIQEPLRRKHGRTLDRFDTGLRKAGGHQERELADTRCAVSRDDVCVAPLHHARSERMAKFDGVDEKTDRTALLGLRRKEAERRHETAVG